MGPGRRQIAMTLASVAAVVAVLAGVLGRWPLAVGLVAALQAAVAVLLVDHRHSAAQAADGLLQRLARSEEIAAQQAEALASTLTTVVESLHNELAASASRQSAAVDRVRSDMLETVGQDNHLAVARLREAMVQQTQEIEAIVQLYTQLAPRAGMPSSGAWAMNATGILTMLDIIGAHQPNLVVELGSGTTSIWLGYALESQGGGRLVAVEHDPRYGNQTRANVVRHGLERIVELRMAPLKPPPIESHETPWYDLGTFDDLHEIGVLVVDGPPGPTGPLARYPAIPLLADHLARDAVVILDDADRNAEREIVRRWRDAGWDLLPHQPGRNLAVLTRSRLA